MRFIRLLIFFSVLSCSAQNRIGTGAVETLYQQYCMTCHGKDLKGGMGQSLLNPSTWKVVGKGTDFIEYVKKGNASLGMPAFEGALSDGEIRSLQIYIEEMRQQTHRSNGNAMSKSADGVYSSGGYRFRLETVIDGLVTPWSIFFVSEDEVLITERKGALRVWKSGTLQAPVRGIPEVVAQGQGGLLEVAGHPDYAENGWIYLAYSGAAEGRLNSMDSMTKIVRGRIRHNQWVDEEVIFEVPASMHRASGVHFGTRLVFKEGYLFFGIGDRGAQDQAQDLSRPNGKIHRIHDDGRIPEGNPFMGIPDAYPTIWTFGNRNPQGLDAHPETGEIFESEHGPRGGDEINLIRPGHNYGWPVITYGMNYNGKPITGLTEMDGMEQPLHYWTPSIAVCGIDFYEGAHFPDWKHHLFVGGLASNELHRLVIEDNRVVKDEIIIKGEGRVRDVASGPDGFLDLVLNGPDRVVRLVPVK